MLITGAADEFARLAALGIDQAIVKMPNVSDTELFDLLGAEVMPEVRRLAVAGR